MYALKNYLLKAPPPPFPRQNAELSYTVCKPAINMKTRKD